MLRTSTRPKPFTEEQMQQVFNTNIIDFAVVFRFIYCMIRLQSAEEEAAQLKKRIKHIIIFYIIAESVWQIKDLVMYYFS